MNDWLTSTKTPAGNRRVEPTIGNLTEFHDVPSSDKAKMLQIFDSQTTAAGAVVNERTALRVSTVFRCLDLIAGAISSLPFPIYERTESGRKRADHEYWWLLNEQAVPAFSAATFWYFMVAQVLMRGDGVAYLRRNRAGVVTGIHPLRRSQVDIKRRDGRLVYLITDDAKDINPDGKQYFGADQDDVLHFPGAGFDGVSSMSVIQWGARQGIGIAMKADEFAGTFFGNGAHIQYAVTSPGKMDEDQQRLFRDAWVAKYGGGQGVSRVPLILTEGLGVKELSMTAEDAQLLDSRKWQVEDIARAFGVPPWMIGHTEKSTSWGSGVEQMGIGFVKYTLGPRLTAIAQELNRKLWPRRERFFIEPNVDALMEGDSKAQAEYFGKALGGPGTQGWMTINEVRRLKNLPPIPGGDKIAAAGAAPPKKEKDDASEAEPAGAADP